VSRKSWPEGAWSPSQFETLRRCPRAHKLRYREKLALIEPPAPAREIGIMFHRVLESVGNAALRGEPTDKELWGLATVAARDKCALPASGLEGTRLVAAYRQRYGDDNAGYGDYKVRAVETTLFGGELHADLGGFASIGDAVVEDADGPIIFEHKTAGRMMSGEDADVIAQLKVGSQACALTYCYYETFGEIPRFVRNVVTKTRTPDLKRYMLTFNKGDLDRWAEEQRALEVLAPMDFCNRDACAPVVGFRCDFFDYCHGTDEQRATLFGPRPKRS
jgi:hypothetical protein